MNLLFFVVDLQIFYLLIKKSSSSGIKLDNLFYFHHLQPIINIVFYSSGIKIKILQK